MATKKKKARKPAKAKSTKAGAARPRARRQPETLRLRGVSPSFTANDLQRSIAFYRDVLGFVVGDEWRGENGVLTGCEMHAGSVVSTAKLQGPPSIPSMHACAFAASKLSRPPSTASSTSYPGG